MAAGGAQPLKATTVTGMRMYAEADFDDNTKTVVQVDYMAAIATEEGYGMPGDVDGNGTVTTKDALMLMQCLNGDLILTHDAFKRADLKGDKVLSAAEALRILQYINGKVTSLEM